MRKEQIYLLLILILALFLRLLPIWGNNFVFMFDHAKDSLVVMEMGVFHKPALFGAVTSIPGVYISSQTFTVAPSSSRIVIEGMVYADKINFARTYFSLTEPTYQIIYQPKYIIDLLPFLGRPQVNWQEVTP